MADKRFGESAPIMSTKEIIATDKNEPGLGWSVSEETQDNIEKIEENIRAAERFSGTLLMG